MNKFIFVGLLMLASTSEARPSTYKLSCIHAQMLIRSRGSMTMNYDYSPQTGDIYARFVTNSSYCFIGERAVNAQVQTLDKPLCKIGKVCVPVVNN